MLLDVVATPLVHRHAPAALDAPGPIGSVSELTRTDYFSIISLSAESTPNAGERTPIVERI